MKGCKKCPAFAKCTVTYRSSGCEALRWTYGIDTDPGIITNADRIREMSDEELCGTIYTMQKALCIHFAKALGFPIEELKFEEDASDILEWFQQPAKEND